MIDATCRSALFALGTHAQGGVRPHFSRSLWPAHHKAAMHHNATLMGALTNAFDMTGSTVLPVNTL